MEANEYNVLIIFYKNINRFRQSFDSICIAKPKNLFLYQDGPKSSEDIPAIMECRQYAESKIDWNCNIFKKYQTENFGCDPSNYIAQKWAFSVVDKCIVLEDDDICSLDFFRFCWSLLIKYENDERVAMICGMNVFDTYNNSGADYFFTSGGSIWTWASWRRFIDSWDETYSWLECKNKIEAMRPYFVSNKSFKSFIQLAKKRKKSGIAYYETIMGVAQMLNHQLNIVPTRNLISNIGNDGGVHSGKGNSSIPKKMQSLYHKKMFDLNFPLKHPTYINDDFEYKKMVYKITHLNIIEIALLKIRKLLNSK